MTGVAAAGVTGSAAAGKVTVQGGGQPAPATGRAQSVRVALVTGHLGIGAGGAATTRKINTGRGGTDVGAVAVAGQHARTSVTGGRVAVVVTSHGKSYSASPALVGVTTTAGTLTKIVTASGASVVGVAGGAAAARTAPVRGRCAAGGTASAGAGKAATAEGTATAGASGDAVFPAVQAATVATPITGSALTSKTALAGGVAGVGCTARGRMARRVAVAGRTDVGVTPAGTSRSKVAPVGGRLVVGAFALGSGVVVGPTVGIRTSPPLALPEFPVVGSRVSWQATVPAGASVTVETSVDNGATWQEAVNAAPVPRLLAGTAITKAVLSRVTLTRVNPDDPSPRLHELEIRVSVDDSRDELVPLGRFTLNEVEIKDSLNGLEVEIAGSDLSRQISRNRWDKTYVVYEGTNYADTIRAVITNRRPGTICNFTTTNMVTPRLFFGEQENNDPWKDAQDMAELIGCELFFGVHGECILSPEPDPELGKSRWEFEDSANPTITDIARRVTDEDTYNVVIVTGESSYNTYPVRGVARDLDPSSPTYIFGPYGLVTYRVTSPMVTSKTQAQEAAEALLRRMKGATESVELEAVPMPAIEPGDVVTVTRGRSRIEGRFLVDQMRIPLGAAEPMRLVGRRQRI